MAKSFAVRGIIEGFYGVPWTHGQRLDMIAFIASLGMNTYVYGPKDDPYLRRDWRMPYATSDLAQLSELVQGAAAVDVAFTYALSPGLSMRYSVSEDFDDLVAKYRQVSNLGVVSFGLLLDDIPGDLQHPTDKAEFDSLVLAQIGMVNRLLAELRKTTPDARLVVCPTTYWGHGDEPYLVSLGQGIPAEVDLFFTGRAICSPEIEVADAVRFAEATGRPPLYWDNFPVNDVAMTGELHIGPYKGRDPGLVVVARGIIANAMPLAEASRIAFVSIADYLRDPASFDAEYSWLRALRLVAGNSGFDAMRTFADSVRGSCLCVDDAPQLQAALNAFAFDHAFGDRHLAVASLRAEGVRMAAAAAELRTELGHNQALVAELEPWLVQFELGVTALSATTEILAKGEPDETSRRVLLELVNGLRSTKLRVFGDALDMFLSDLAQEFFRS
jgi:hyaluronoglucosaminidase